MSNDGDNMKREFESFKEIVEAKMETMEANNRTTHPRSVFIGFMYEVSGLYRIVPEFGDMRTLCGRDASKCIGSRDIA